MNRERGQGFAEYVFILAGVAVLVIIALAVVAPGLARSLAGLTSDVPDVSASITYQSPVYAEDKLIIGLDSSEIGMVDMDYLIWYSGENHASDKHGDQLSWAIREECESNPLFTVTRASDGRKAKACWFEKNGEQKIGISIYEAWDDFVTSFPNKSDCAEKVLEYLGRAGYK